VEADVDGFGRIWLRSSRFERPATVKPSALLEDAYSASIADRYAVTGHREKSDPFVDSPNGII
jgi:hypothetical protein